MPQPSPPTSPPPPSQLPFASELKTAQLAVQRASILTKKVQDRISSSRDGSVSKPDDTPVTAADFAAQLLLCSAVRAAFPHDALVGEENADALREDEGLAARVWELLASAGAGDDVALPRSRGEMLDLLDDAGRGEGGREGRFWVMDPIDGTATFVRGGHYAVSLALVQDGREVVGVLGCPNLGAGGGRIVEGEVDGDSWGVMFSAVRGQGATKRAIAEGSLAEGFAVSRGDVPRDLSGLHFVDSLVSKSWDSDTAGKVAGAFGAVYPSTDVFSSHVRYAALIAGGGHVQLRIPKDRQKKVYIWDHAGSQLIFTEAGGKMTDLRGQEVDFGAGRELSNNWGLIMADEAVHGVVLAKVRELLGLE